MNPQKKGPGAFCGQKSRGCRPFMTVYKQLVKLGEMMMANSIKVKAKGLILVEKKAITENTSFLPI